MREIPQDEYTARFTEWIDDVKVLLSGHDYYIYQQQLEEFDYLSRYRDQFATCLNHLIESERLNTALADRLFTASMPDLPNQGINYCLMDKVANPDVDLPTKLNAVYDEFNQHESLSADKIIFTRLRLWLRMALVERTQEQSAEAVSDALEMFFDHNKASHPLSHLPVFGQLPEGLRLFAKKRLDALPEDERYDETGLWDKHKVLYGKKLPQLADVIEVRLSGAPLDQAMIEAQGISLTERPSALKDNPISLLDVPIALKPLDQLLPVVLTLPTERQLAYGRTLNEYSADELARNLPLIKTLIDGFSDDVDTQRQIAQRVMLIASPYTEQGRHIFEQIIPPESRLASYFRGVYTPFMSMDYLVTMINAQRNQPDSFYQGFTTEPMKDNYQPKLIDLYDKSREASQTILTILKDMVQRDLNAMGPVAPTDYSEERQMIRHTARLLNETALDQSAVSVILQKLTPNWSNKGSNRNPIPFLNEAIAACKPFLKRSRVDELMEVEQGRMLIDDIVELNRAGNEIAPWLTLKVEQEPLTTIDSRVQKVVGYVAQRIEKDVGKQRLNTLIDERTFDNML